MSALRFDVLAVGVLARLGDGRVLVRQVLELLREGAADRELEAGVGGAGFLRRLEDVEATLIGGAHVLDLDRSGDVAREPALTLRLGRLRVRGPSTAAARRGRRVSLDATVTEGCCARAGVAAARAAAMRKNRVVVMVGVLD